MSGMPERAPGGRGRRTAVDLAAGTALLVLEGLVLVVLDVVAGLGDWGVDGAEAVRAQDRLDLTRTTHWFGGLIAVAVVAAALAVWRRAPFTAVVQVLAALALVLLLGRAHAHYDTRYPHPAPPRNGPVCFSGSNDCP